MKQDANIETFEVVSIFGQPALFTSLRIDRDTVPENMFCYDLRFSDNGDCICEVKNFVLVNHAGAIITKEEITPREWNENTYTSKEGIELETDAFNFLDISAMRLEEFKNKDNQDILNESTDSQSTYEQNMQEGQI